MSGKPSDSGDASRRYSRHIALAEIGAAGQRKLRASRALVVGLGGLGSPAAMYLAAAGVGELVLNDFDRVDETNLQRQLLYGDADVGRSKCAAAAATLARLNRATRIECMERRLHGAQLEATVRSCDVVLDGSDNFGTRFNVNAACVRTGTPLVTGAAIRFEGQLAVFRPDLGTGPCYRCLYDEADETNEDCRGQGIFAPVVGVVGSLMAVEAAKLLAGVDPPTCGRLLLYDARASSWREVRLTADPACPVCGSARPSSGGPEGGSA